MEDNQFMKYSNKTQGGTAQNFDEQEERARIRDESHEKLENAIVENLKQRKAHRKYLEQVRFLLAEVEGELSNVFYRLQQSKFEH